MTSYTPRHAYIADILSYQHTVASFITRDWLCVHVHATWNFIRELSAHDLADIVVVLCFATSKQICKTTQQQGRAGGGQKDDGPNRTERFDRLIRQDVVISESACVAPTIPKQTTVVV